MPGSIAEELGIEPGDKLLSIDGQEIEDIFDYQFYVEDEEIVLLIEKQDGEQWELEIEKDAEHALIPAGTILIHQPLPELYSKLLVCIFFTGKLCDAYKYE